MTSLADPRSSIVTTVTTDFWIQLLHGAGLVTPEMGPTCATLVVSGQAPDHTVGPVASQPIVFFCCKSVQRQKENPPGI